MEIKDVVGMVPEDQRADVEAYFDGATIIKSQDDVQELISASGKNAIKSVFDQAITARVESGISRFKEEKMNPLIEEQVQAKVKELNPEKPEWQIKMDALEKELNQTKSQAVQKEQLAYAIQRAPELGIPANVDILKPFIGSNTEETDKQLDLVAGVLKPWQEGALTEQRASLIGKAGKPEQGASNAKTISRAEFDRLSPSDKMKQIQSGVKPIDE